MGYSSKITPFCFQFNFTVDLRSSLIKPLMREIEKLETSNKKFRVSHCFKSKHLFLRNLLLHVHSLYPGDQYMTKLLNENLKNSDLRLKPDIEAYLSQLHQEYLGKTHNRTFPETALVPLSLDEEMNRNVTDVANGKLIR